MPKGNQCSCGCGVTPSNYRTKFFETWSNGYPFQNCGLYYCANYGMIDKNGDICTFKSTKCPQAHVDHIVAKSKGGPNCINNLRIMCAHCNTSKNDICGDYEDNLFSLGSDNCRVYQKQNVVRYQNKNKNKNKNK